MCGVCGILGINGNSIPGRESILHMTEALAHRGPDGKGVYSDKCCALGHRRLSVIDLESGEQPMSTGEGRWIIVYNGEVYNYRELRYDLEHLGERFFTNSDTEVVLRGLVKYGPIYLERLNGIFALAFWDRDHGKLLLARDHVGIKPLYYANTGRHFIFGSEPKAIFSSGLVEKRLNNSALFEYFCRQAPPYLETLYKDVYEVRPGSWLLINTYGQCHCGVYYDLESGWRDVDPVTIPDLENELVTETYHRLSASVDRQLVSDVPVGISLSQGVDSGLLLDLLVKSAFNKGKGVQAFTYDNQSWQSEADGACEIVSRIGFEGAHHIFPVTLREHLASFGDVTRFFDAPVIYPSSVPMLNLSHLARQNGVKVLMGGQGADELFLGYDRYGRWSNILDGSEDPEQWAQHFYFGGGINNVGHVEKLTGIGRDYAVASPAWEWVKANWDLPPLKRMAIYDQRFRMHYLLKRDDRMGMGGGVECRVPFLDKEFLNWSNAVPERWKIHNGSNKAILRKVAQEVLTAEITHGRKVGSPTVFQEWIHSHGIVQILDMLVSRENSFSRNYLNYEYVLTLIDQHRDRHCFDFLMWSLFAIEFWFVVCFGGEQESAKVQSNMMNIMGNANVMR